MLRRLEGVKLIPYNKSMPYPPPRIAEYYCIQYESANVHDESFYLECLEVLYKYNLRQRPKDREVNHG